MQFHFLTAAVVFRFVSVFNKLNATVFVFAEHLSNVRWKVNSGFVWAFGNSHISIRELSFSPWPIANDHFKTNMIHLNQEPSFQRKITLNDLQRFNIILSICTSIYWFKHCNVSKSTSFMKAFCRLLTHQSVNYFFAVNDYDAMSNFIPVSC